ncbi:MAG: gamma-glutamyltransferase [Alphaproteobacteria bacterium]|nr:MAG: gamma-glutamyltransferase [Alphaproteobacteria bacterium]
MGKPYRTGHMTKHRLQTFELRKPVVASAGGIVASQSLDAARAGVEILQAGGNAVDAAVATGLALAAVEPWMSGLGGGGYMMVYTEADDRVRAVDFGMIAPAMLDPADYPLAEGTDSGLFGWPAVVDGRNLKGVLSVAVPGQVDGMRLALESFGRLSWREVVKPAIRLAEEGLPLDWYGSLSIAIAARELAEFAAARDVYLPGGLPPAPGSEGSPPRLRLGNLAATLRHLAEAGPRDFYEGDLARSIAADMAAGGGRLSAGDLAAYRATLVDPLEIAHGDARIAAAPGLTAGPTLARTLALMEPGLPAAARREGRPDGASYAAIAAALETAYAERLAGSGGDGEPPSRPSVAPVASCTSHLSVVDRDGNMVALTQTLLSRFGSKVLLPGSGIMMNNGIMWFDPRPDRPNGIAPGRRPLSNMCPVIARMADGRRVALGASGGRRIMPAVAQLLSFLADFGMDLEAAFHCPRLDVSGGGSAVLDARLAPDVLAAVERVMPAAAAELAAYPVLFASPSATLRRDGRNEGMADIASPWSGAAAEP